MRTVHVRGDPTRIRQVLMNLVGNAIKFTDRGGVFLQVDLRPLSDGTVRLRAEVRDTGIGIGPEVQQTLFQKFTQADPTITRRYGGTGLGLAISKGFVELLGGEIGARSGRGCGSTFWFTAILERARSMPAGREELRLSLRGAKVLVVDDMEVNRCLLRRQLEREGMIVEEAEDAFAGMAAFERTWHRGEAFDVALLDQMMPGMAGEDMAKRISTAVS
jgi:hypothetical protein